jgi:hypothetical protein
LDDKLVRIKQLIELKEQTDAELEALIGGANYVKKKVTCSICGTEGHTARTCPQKSSE